MTDTLLRTLQSVVIGARQLEDFCGVVVSAAVEDALLCVARDYGHDYAVLLKRYKDEVVRRHASGALQEKTQCRGTTKDGRPCTRRAKLHGYCGPHAAQMAEDQAKRRRVEAYKASVPRQDADSLVELLLGRKHPSADAFKVAPHACVLHLL